MSYREAVSLIVRLLQHGNVDAADDIGQQVITDAACFTAALYLFFDLDREACLGFAHVFSDCLHEDIRTLRIANVAN